MGYKNKKSLTRQIQENLDSKLRIGESKHLDKLSSNAKNFDMTEMFIYSWETYRSYMKHCNYFTKYCKENHKCKTLEDCRQYIGEWLQTRNDLSAYTIRLEMAALCKLYGMTTDDIKKEFNYVPPKRERDKITRSRNKAVRDSHFSETKNYELVTFCKCTGLRRGELQSLKADKLIHEDGNYYILVDSGTKGGKTRKAQVMAQSDEELQVILDVFERAKNEPNKKVWPKVNTNADIHSYRSDYAGRCYLSKARDIDTLSTKDKFFMRGDRKGTVFDRQAMLFASKNLGHNRVDIIGSHYLRNLS